MLLMCGWVERDVGVTYYKVHCMPGCFDGNETTVVYLVMSDEHPS